MTRTTGQHPDTSPVRTQALAAVEAALGLVSTRPLGSHPDGFHRSSHLGPALPELITEVRRLREAITAVLLADRSDSAQQALDRSRNRRRRYCSSRCGTRARMAEHRQQAHA